MWPQLRFDTVIKRLPMDVPAIDCTDRTRPPKIVRILDFFTYDVTIHPSYTFCFYTECGMFFGVSKNQEWLVEQPMGIINPLCISFFDMYAMAQGPTPTMWLCNIYEDYKCFSDHILSEPNLLHLICKYLV